MGYLPIVLAAMASTAPQDNPVIARPLPPAVIAAPPAPPTPEQLRRMRAAQISPPRPIGPGTWISQEDYPAAAIRANAEGFVAYRLQVDAAGRPNGCSVTQGSGNADLDAATCALLTRRGRFEPARDANGQAVAGTYTSRVRWDLRGRLRPVPEAREMVIMRTVAPDGAVSDCTFSAKGAPAAVGMDPCKTLRFAPDTGPNAKSRRVRLTTRAEYLDE